MSINNFKLFLYDIRSYTTEIYISIQEILDCKYKNISLYCFDYLNTFVLNYISSIEFKHDTILPKGMFLCLNINTCLDIFKNINCGSIVIMFKDSHLYINDIEVQFKIIDIPLINKFKNRKVDKDDFFVLNSPQDLIKYNANITILSSTCEVSFVKKDNNIFLKFHVQQELGNFVHLFRIQSQTTTQCIPTHNVTISLKVFRVIMTEMLKENTYVTCSLTNTGLYFKLFRNNILCIIFFCQHTLLIH
jgi:hypothetical protein